MACAIAAARCGEAQPASRLTPESRAELDSIASLEQMSVERHAPPEELRRITARWRRADQALNAAQTRAEAHAAMLVHMCALSHLSDVYGSDDAAWLKVWVDTHPPRQEVEDRTGDVGSRLVSAGLHSRSDGKRR